MNRTNTFAFSLAAVLSFASPAMAQTAKWEVLAEGPTFRTLYDVNSVKRTGHWVTAVFWSVRPRNFKQILVANCRDSKLLYTYKEDESGWDHYKDGYWWAAHERKKGRKDIDWLPKDLRENHYKMQAVTTATFVKLCDKWP